MADTPTDSGTSPNPRPGCGCLGAFLGLVIVSGVAGAAARAKNYDGDTTALMGMFDGLIGALIGALFGVALAGPISAPLRPLERSRVTRSLAAVILLVVGFLASAALERLGEVIFVPTKLPAQPSAQSIPSRPAYSILVVPDATGATPAPRRPTSEQKRRPPRVLNPALEPGDY